jgi:membrane fusion protein, multidrug efflux system
MHRGLNLLAALVVLGGCVNAKQAPQAPQTPEVSVVTLRKASVPVVTELPGRTSAYLVAQVRARVDGIVLKREFQEGADVKTGQRLYQIDPAPFRAALDNAIAVEQKMQAGLASATALAERYKILLPGNGVSRQDYDNASAAQGQAAGDLAAAKAAVQEARINLGYTNVGSPIAGRIGVSLVTPGAFVQQSAATLMSTVQQIDPIYVDVSQSSAEGLQFRRDLASGRVKVNGAGAAKVTLLLEDGTEYPLAGKLQFTDITVDPNTGSVTVRAVFPNPDHVLLPGMFVRARVEQGVNDRAMLVPQQGVTRDPQGHATAFVVDGNNKVAQRVLQATRTLGDKWVVEGGLAEGERVIVAGVQKVQPGATVRAVEAPARAQAQAPEAQAPAPEAQAPATETQAPARTTAAAS